MTKLVVPKNIGVLKFKSLLWKRYFDVGYTILSYIKYIAVLMGGRAMLDNDTSLMVWLAVGYALLCFVVGWAWHRFDLIQTEVEIANQFNMFVEEVREKLK